MALMRLMMIMATIFAASSASADWVRVHESESMSAYVDLPTIGDEDGIVKMWILIDYRSPRFFSHEKGHYRSIKAQTISNCLKKETRENYLSFHAGSMANGHVVTSTVGFVEWAPVRQNTIEEDFWRIACAGEILIQGSLTF